MMRVVKNIVMGVVLLSTVLVSCWTWAEHNRWGNYGSRPIDILDTIHGESNDDPDYAIQETALDGAVHEVESWEYRMRNTLKVITNHINIYLQWLLYIGLSVAVILLIVNGLMMVTGAFHKYWDVATVKKNIFHIGIGVVLMSGFYAVVKLILALVNMVFALA